MCFAIFFNKLQKRKPLQLNNQNSSPTTNTSIDIQGQRKDSSILFKFLPQAESKSGADSILSNVSLKAAEGEFGHRAAT